MPIEFYPDTDTMGERDESNRCLDTITLFDGPGVCKRNKGHKVDDDKNPAQGNGEFHQEEFEGWIWNDRGLCG